MAAFQAFRPGELLNQDTFYWGTLKGVGKVYARSSWTSFGSFAFAKLYTSTTPPEAKPPRPDCRRMTETCTRGGAHMSFRPIPGQPWRIFSKVSGKAMDVPNKSTDRGTGLQQWSANNDSSQNFEFYPAGGHQYFVKPQSVDLHWDVERGSRDNGARLIQWSWNGDDNQKFRFLPAGEGFYFIKAVESGKCLRVKDASTGDGASIVQWDPGVTDDYKFLPMPPGLKYTDVVVEGSYRTPDELMRTLIVNGLSVMPYVGGFVSGVVGFFWKSAGPQQMWDQMREYVAAYVGDILNRARVKELGIAVRGIEDAVRELERYRAGDEKGQRLTSINVLLTAAERFFFEHPNPEEILSELVQLGTLRLALLRDAYLFGEVYYPRDGNLNRETHGRILLEKIEQYLAVVESSRDKGLTRRLNMITNEAGQRWAEGTQGSVRQFVYTVKDRYAGWSLESASWGSDSTTHDRSAREAEAASQNYFEQRKAQVEAEFSARLDQILSPSKVWTYFVPGSGGPKLKVVRYKSGPFGKTGGTAFSDPLGGPQFMDDPSSAPAEGMFPSIDPDPRRRIVRPNGNTFESVTVYADRNGVRGIGMVRKGGSNLGVHGMRSGTAHQLTLGEGESIVGAYGWFGRSLNSLNFETDRGRTFGGGSNGGNEWRADPPDGSGAWLDGFSGTMEGDYIRSVTLHWMRGRKE